MTGLNPKHLNLPKHKRDKMVGGVLEDSLRNQYQRNGVRVIKGDSVRVIRGEYKGVEGKVDKVDTQHATFHIEGIQRDKIRGGQVKIPIHSSNVIVIALNLEDKHRSKMLQARTNGGLTSSDEQDSKEKTKTEVEKE